MQVVRKEDKYKAYLDSLYVVSHSNATVTTYKTAINNFRFFLTEQYLCDEFQLTEKILAEELDVYKVFREFAIYLDKKGIHPQPIRVYLSGVKGYLRHLGVKINSDDFRYLVKLPKKTRTRKIPVTKEMLIQLLHSCPLKLQTAILMTTSSAMRIGELVQLKVTDIDFNSKPTKIYIRGLTTKTQSTRETFISTETTKILKDYLRRYYNWKEGEQNDCLQNVYIFGKTPSSPNGPYPTFSLNSAKLTMQKSLRNHMANIPELNVTNENGLKAIHFHAFREYFRTNVGNEVGRDFAEAIMGHDFYMSTYYNLPEPKKLELYLKAEPALTISDAIAVEKSYSKLSDQYENLQEKFDGFMTYLHTNGVKVPEEFRTTSS